MTSHHQPSNVVKFPPIGECDPQAHDCFTGAPIDFGPTSYGPSYHGDTRPNLFDQLGAESFQRDRADHIKRLARQAKREKLVRAFCIAVAVFAVVYFGGRELLAVFQ